MTAYSLYQNGCDHCGRADSSPVAIEYYEGGQFIMEITPENFPAIYAIRTGQDGEVSDNDGDSCWTTAEFWQIICEAERDGRLRVRFNDSDR